MITESKIIMQYLPPSLGIFVVVVAAGIMGLFRSMALNKTSYDNTVDSLQRQIKILKEENELLRGKLALISNAKTEESEGEKES